MKKALAQIRVLIVPIHQTVHHLMTMPRNLRRRKVKVKLRTRSQRPIKTKQKDPLQIRNAEIIRIEKNKKYSDSSDS